MKQTSVTILTIGFLLYSNLINGQTLSKFMGKWELNVKLSDLGKMPLSFAFNSMEVEQTQDSIKIKRISKQLIESGDPIISQVFALNGQPSSMRSEFAKRTKLSSIIFDQEHNMITETATLKYDNVPTDAYQTGYKEIWVLNSDGTVLTVTRNMLINDPRLNWKTKLVYNKDSYK